MGFVVDAEKGEFINKTTATAHFLFINTIIFVKKIFGLSSIMASKSVVVFFAALSVSTIFLIIHEITKKNFLSIIGAFIFGFSFSFWKNAEIVEVYTMNTFFVSVFILFVTKSLLSKNPKYLLFSALFLGISLWVHVQNILFFPAFIYLLYIFRDSKKQIIFSVSILLVIFGALYIQPLVTGLPIKYVLKSGSWVEDSLKKPWKNYFFDIMKSILYLIYNFWFYLIFIIPGVIFAFKNYKDYLIFLMLGILPIYGFATFYAVSDNYVFFISSYISLVIFISLGINTIQSHKFKKLIYFSTFLIPIFYVLSYQIAFKTKQGTEFDEFKNYKGGLKYYLYPWMNNNKGLLEFTINKEISTEKIPWMIISAKEFIKITEKKYTLEQLKKM